MAIVKLMSRNDLTRLLFEIEEGINRQQQSSFCSWRTTGEEKQAPAKMFAVRIW